MTGFDTIAIVDWSAGKRAPARPSKDAIWIGVTRSGLDQEPVYCRSRIEAEAWLSDFIGAEAQAGRRVLIGFDFPFGYPRGFVRHVTGSDDPLTFWDWLTSRIMDSEAGENNRFDVASEINRLFDGPGPFWGKPSEDSWPDIPYRKVGISYDSFAERRACDLAAKASSSCFQLFFNPTVGSQALMGLPMLSRLRRRGGVSVWPFEDWSGAQTVLVEIWPGLIEPAVKEVQNEEIRDAAQVRLLARALASLSAERLHELLTDVGQEAPDEAWILGAGHADELVTAARGQIFLAPPPLRNDCFALPAGVDWTPVDDALALLSARMHAVVGVETVPLMQACGRVLAEDLIAKRSNPPHPNTAVDGYGFSGAAIGDGPQILPLVDGRAAAGAPFAGLIPEGQAIRVLTGADLPDGVDTVVLDEDVRVGDGHVAFHGPLRPGANTRKAGEDVREGEAALSAGRVLTPADLALAAAVGHGSLEVRKRLRVAVLSTGDEIVEPGAQAAEGQIFDANRPMLLSLCAGFGFEVVDMGCAADDRGAVRAALDRASAQADVILTSGGASAGDEDHISALLRETGSMQEWRIALKPGRPLALGLWDGVPVFGLPGNPVAALVCTLIFARPAMAALSGAGWFEPQGFTVPAAFEKRKKPGRREYLRSRIRDGRAEVFKSEGSGRISGLSWAEGLVELPDGAVHVQPGDPVRYIPFLSFS
ncbi:gephyrin-like molybdotransferase Glp [Marivita sp. XM-24bin2]|uniref:molybdopterin-binding protein n=1 Tax=unclassified Marivita TaxID=2632480 RepID=UPI000D7A6772|nr:gephyrin-like molybdotransferase Glp [Marivita sp. XM-24bin2]MCR9108357.1 molybdopterin-binding protein [Paracoccaceae bacterium]PWL36350.1 MAG: molybdopterin molybdenumtransferase MoeA [Marivita sp. XM-24bin2]